MSATSTTTWQWSSEVLAFARKEGVEGYLEPLRQATVRLFPTLSSLRVLKEDDPEISDLSCVTYEIRVPHQDVPDFVEANHLWTDELYRICPAPLVCNFVLLLFRDE